MDKEETVFQSGEKQKTGNQAVTHAPNSSSQALDKKKIDLADILAKLKDPKVKLAILAGGIILTVVTFLVVVLIIIKLLSPAASPLVKESTNVNVDQGVEVTPAPQDDELQKLKGEVQNFDLEERPLLPPKIEFDIEF